MRIINILSVVFLLSFSSYSQDKLARFNSIYSGGIDSLRHDLGKNVVNSISEIDKDYFVFFEITLKSKDFILVSELYRKPDAVSAKVGKAIEATYSKWKRMDPNTKIIVPIFLINDQENIVQTKKIYTYTQRNYPFTNEIVNGLLIAPIIVNYFHQNKETASVFSQSVNVEKINWEKNTVCGDDFELSIDWRTTNMFVRDKFQNIKFKKYIR